MTEPEDAPAPEQLAPFNIEKARSSRSKCTVSKPTIEKDTPRIRVLPDGPYGTGYLETIQDLEFWDPWTGEAPRLSDYYMNPDVSVLVVSSAAGWCTACMY